MLYTRVFYAIVLLCKISMSIESPRSSICKMVPLDGIKLVEYLYRTMSLLKSAAGDDRFAVAEVFYLIVTKLTAWYHRQQQRGSGDQDDTIEPMAYSTPAEERIMRQPGISSDAERSTIPSRRAQNIEGPATATHAPATVLHPVNELPSRIQSEQYPRPLPDSSSHTQHIGAPASMESAHPIPLAVTAQPPSTSWDFETFHQFAEFDMFSAADYSFEDSAFLMFGNEDSGINQGFI